MSDDASRPDPTPEKPEGEASGQKPAGDAVSDAPKPAAGAPAPLTGSKALWIASVIVVLIFAAIWGTIWLSIVNPARSEYQPAAENRRPKANTSGPATPGNDANQPQSQPGNGN